ncbi:uncharacterized protein [Pyxicephalus adspersus]|uniref:uncharacterized protein n=1 Tax=Pyxicephalus adspersus TaxID=30357 RepID=UPI003B5CD5E3
MKKITCLCVSGNSSNTYCPDTKVTCPKGTICARVHALSTAGNTSVEINKSACLPVYQCGISGSASSLNGTLRLVTICSTNNCNLPEPELTGPEPASSINGLTCPTCVSENAEWCNANDFMQCVGNETTCSTYTTKVLGTPMVFRGCATMTNCILSKLTHSTNGSDFDFKFDCINNGNPLTCIQCLSTNSTSCTGNAVTCPNGYFCGTSYTESTVAGVTRYIRSCTPQTQCDKIISVTTLYGTTKMSTSCCTSDNCTAPILAVQPPSSELNGVTCPSCQSSQSTWCHDAQTVQCKGEETVCALHSTTIDGKSSAIRGCARPSACDTQTYTINGKSIIYQGICSCGGNVSNTYCPDTNVTCPTGTICATVHALTTMGDASFERYTSTCLPIYQCGIAGSATFLKGTMKLVTQCSTNNCNLPAKFSAENLTPNGMVCQSCMAADADCSSSERMQCTGDEQWCFFQAADLTEMTSAKSAIRGCVTRNICDLGTQTYNALGIKSNVKYICSSGSKHFLTNLFTPLLVLCTLIMRNFF